jgi:hypothetical protein
MALITRQLPVCCWIMAALTPDKGRSFDCRARLPGVGLQRGATASRPRSSILTYDHPFECHATHDTKQNDHHHQPPTTIMQINQLKQRIEKSSITEVILARAPDNRCPGYWFMWAMAGKKPNGQIINVEKDIPVAFETLDESLELLSSFGYDGKVTVAWERGMPCN